MKFVTRAQWGARAPKYRNTATMLAESTCHWNGPTVTVKGQKTWDHSKCAALVRGIQNYHMDGHGWSDVAYNYLACPHGYTFEGRGINVINGANGTNSGNRSSHAICCLGGESNPFGDQEKRGFRDTIHYIADRTTVPRTCKGHRDHKPTQCPGNARYDWVHKGMPILLPPTPPSPAKKGKKMNSFLFRTTKDNTVWLVSGDLMSKRWVENPSLLEGYKTLLKANGLSDAVCVLDLSEPMSAAVANVEAIGKVPKNYVGPRR